MHVLNRKPSACHTLSTWNRKQGTKKQNKMNTKIVILAPTCWKYQKIRNTVTSHTEETNIKWNKKWCIWSSVWCCLIILCYIDFLQEMINSWKEPLPKEKKSAMSHWSGAPKLTKGAYDLQCPTSAPLACFLMPLTTLS